MKVHLISILLIIVLQLPKGSNAALGEKTRNNAEIEKILSASAQELQEMLLPSGRELSYGYQRPIGNNSMSMRNKKKKHKKAPKHKKAKKVTVMSDYVGGL